ncbi:MAG: PLP-dependent transferase [Candidatus Eisenbacteria bacterium]|nr:PLP-dependent transferase [Candidatus Eisenbacteria bacterium]
MTSRRKPRPRRAAPHRYGGSATPAEERYAPGTVLVHGKFRSRHWNYSDHIVPPISASAAYRLESVERGAEGFLEFANPEFNRAKQAPIYIYDRLDEPTRGMLEESLALAEGGERAVCFATGMAAISGALGVLLRAGDRVVAHRTLYGCTWSLFANWYPRYGIGVDLVDFKNGPELQAALERAGVMAAYCESPANPTLELLDLRALARRVARVNARRAAAARGRAHRRIFTVVDNTFATPICQRPLAHGVDLVVHSLTKNLGGFGTDMGGAVVGARLLEPDLLLYRKDFGAPLAPRSAWGVLAYGLPSLALRVKAEQESAIKVARFLELHPKVARVSYPGLASHADHALARRQMRDPGGRFAPGTLVYFVLHGSPAEARRRGAKMMDHLASRSLAITLAVSLGQVRTLIEHPASMTHAAVPPEEQRRAGIDPGGVRISLGVEDVGDIIADLKDALARV